MENFKAPTNFFYDEISNNLSKKSPETLIKEINNIDTSKPITTKNLKLLGSISFLTGMDFIQPNYIIEQKQAILERFKLNNINSDVWDTFNKKMSEIKSFDILINAKDEIKESISEKVKFASAKQEIDLKTIVKKIINLSDFSVSIATDIHSLETKNHYTYHDCLKFNSSLFEQFTIEGELFQSLSVLFESNWYKEILNEATTRFDNQKFAVIYFDGICTYLESKNDLRIKNLFVDTSEELINPVEEDNSPATEEEVKTYEEALKKSEILAQDTDMFIKKCIRESLFASKNPESTEDKELEVTNYNEFKLGAEWILSNDDYLSSFYEYIKRNLHVNRKSFVEVWGIDKEKFFTEFDEDLKAISALYKKEAEDYMSEIPEDILSELVRLISGTIVSLKIDNTEAKGYLFTQYTENQITNYRQLHQIIDVIEKCNINGSKIGNYVKLYDYINNNEEILSKFKNSENIDIVKIKLQFYSAFYDFLNFDNIQ